MCCDRYISIVLFVHDDVNRLEKCLCHILDFTPAQGYELIVAECEDCREMHEYVSRLPNIRVVSDYAGMQAGARYKKAAEMATGTDIVFMHDCIFLSEGWLESLRRVMSACEGAAVAYPRVKKQETGGYQEALEVYYGCFMLNRELLASLGGFNSGYLGERHLLIDLSLRILREGWRIFSTGECEIACASLKDNFFSNGYLSCDRALFKQLYDFEWIYSSVVREDILSLIDYTKENVRILEIGCACGATLLKIKNGNPTAELYGLELCRPAAEVAGKFANVQSTNFEELSREDFAGSFDYILMGDVLEHLFDTDKALQKVWQWLRPGGQLVVSVPNIAHVFVLYNLLQGRWDYVDMGILDRTHVRFFTLQSIQGYLQRNGFNIRHVCRRVFDLNEGEKALIKALMELPSLDIKKEDLDTYQVICVAEKLAR